jgi:NAD(P)-dependent dehydrogenase (short-subunit alcohol dehydrogenase family)
MKDLRGKVAVVTGAASCIGLALAERFAAEGMKVALADIELSALDEARTKLEASGAEVLAVVTDVSKPEEVERLAESTVERFGAVHVVCNNAGVGAGGPCWEHSLADWHWVLGVNLWGVIHGIHSFVPRMLKQGGEGHIVNTASIAGLVTGPGMGVYGVTKHGVVALSECLHHELKMFGSSLGVSVLCPAWVQTRIGDSDRNRPASLPEGSHAQSPQGEMARQLMRHLISTGIPPSAAAGAVVDAIQKGRFYVLTHPQFKRFVKARFDAILDEKNPEAVPMT